MCHSHMKIEFDITNNNCFFIGGSNGSGKSAILAALNIGLGGQGSMNERGNSLQDYIKYGKKRAKITTMLSNKGYGRHEDFGEYLIVERILTPAGSTYQLISVEGSQRRFVNCRKRDLDSLLARFGIQLRNPIFWMSQDRCRVFLQEMKPERLYSLFMLATGLDSAQDCYTGTNEKLKEVDKWKAVFEEYVKDKKREFAAMKAACDRASLLGKYKESLSKLQWLLCWLPYRDATKEAIKYEKEYEKVIEECNRREQVYIEKQKEKVDISARNETIRKELAKIDEKIEHSQRKEEEGRKVCEERERELKEAMQRLSAKNKELKIVEAEISSLGNWIKEMEKKKLQSETASTMQSLRASLTECDSKLNELRGQRSEIEHQLAALKKDLADAEADELKWRVELRRREEAVKAANNKQDRARAMQQDRVGRFGGNMRRIMRLVEDNSRLFTRKPIGPVGNHVSVLDDRYSSTIENVLSPVLRAFILDNPKDCRTFEDLLIRNSIRPPVRITSQFSDQRYCTREREPPDGMDTVLRLIKVDNTNVFNVLVDQLHIESILLFDDDNHARRLMATDPPRNVRKAFTMSGAEVIPKSNTRVYRFYANTRVENSVRILSQSHLLDPSMFDAEVAETRETLNRSRTTYAQVKERQEKVSKELRALTSRLERVQQEITNLQQQRGRFSRELEAGGDDEGLANRILNMEKCVNEYRVKAAEVNARIEKLKAEVKNCEEKRQTAEDDRNNFRLEKSELKLKAEIFKNELKTVTERLEYIESELTQHEQSVQRSDAIKNDFKTKVDTARAKASRMKEEAAACISFQRPQAFEDPPDLTSLPETKETQNEYNALKRRIEAIQKNAQSVVTAEELKAMKDRYNCLKHECLMINDIRKGVEVAMELRRKEFHMRCGLIGMIVGSMYETLLSCRHFRGHLEISHSQRTIRIVTKPSDRIDDSSLDNSGSVDNLSRDDLQDLKGLSGGERTYTMACFIMALWDAIDAPFRCMDEFDVFLDMNNRRMVMELLISLATRRYPHKQFIFFTPQRLSDMGHHERVQVFQVPKIHDT
uniref:Structural maintenance of chromosomes protein 6 n=1 Tax=Ascaris suum TaxID=6253 RepID=F1KS45_ASCSU